MSEEDEIIEAPEAPPEAQAENERKPERRQPMDRIPVPG
jgi:hypothetical protein